MIAQPTQPTAEAPAGSGGGDGPSSIFLTKEMLGGRTVKAGDKLTVEVKSIDPESGEAEATIEASHETNENPDLGAEGFDAAMPPEEG